MKGLAALTLLLSLWLYGGSFAQNGSADSLKHALSIAMQDSNRVLIMAELCSQYRISNPDSALQYGQRALTLAREINFLRGESQALMYMGVVIRELGNLSKALELTVKALNIARTNHFDWEEGRCLIRMANIYILLKDYPRALSYFHQSRLKHEAMHDFRSLAISNMLLGDAYEQKNNVDSALYYEQKVYNELYRPELAAEKPGVLRFMGNIYAKLDSHKLAVNYYKAALLASDEQNDVRNKSSAYIDIAVLYRKMHQLDSCIFYAKKGLAYAQTLSYKKRIMAASSLLADVYEPTNPKEALRYYKLATEAQDSLYNSGRIQAMQSMTFNEEERQRDIEAASIAYQNGVRQYALLAALAVFLVIALLLYRSNRLKQKAGVLLQAQKQQIETLNKDLEQRVEQRTIQLQAALIEAQGALLKGQTTERKRVASELHDNLGGLLAAIKMMTSTIDYRDLHPQEREIYEQLVGMINDANREVRSLSHNLLPEELEKQGLVASLQTLISKLNHNGKTQFEIRVNGLTERLSRQTEFNLYTICLELCNNILKHAQATEASIELVQKPHTLQLLVSDNGTGFDLTVSGKNGMGLRNLQERANAIDATATIHAHPGQGTLIRVSIPLTTPIQPSHSVAQT